MRDARDRIPADLIEQKIRGPPAELVEPRAQRGQRRIGEIRERHIVEADDRDVLRDVESRRLQDLHDADGIQVGPGHHRRARQGGAFEELSAPARPLARWLSSTPMTSSGEQGSPLSASASR